MSTTAVIPIKQLENAKQRLSGLLDSDERKLLFRAMVEDVLTAVEACVTIDQIVVVTDDQQVAELARAYGAQIRPEPRVAGLIEAVTQSSRQLRQEGVSTMLFLPGDVPLVTAEELEVVLEGFGVSAEPEFIIVPASDLGGSNCVACSPPDCMTFGFGVDSFRRHLEIANSLGVKPLVVKLPGIGLDVDTPADLQEFIEVAGREKRDCLTLRFVFEHDIQTRLEELATRELPQSG